jgi:Domain of unknown function (DUF4436)
MLIPESDPPKSLDYHPSESKERRRRVAAASKERLRRILTVAAIFGVSALAYLVLSLSVSLSQIQERQFGSPTNEAVAGVYIQPISIDAPNDSMQVKFSVMPPLQQAGSAPLNVASKELILMIRRGNQTEKVNIHAHQPLPETTYEIDLNDGSFHNYPLDHYNSRLGLRLVDATQGSGGAVLPIHITLWEGLFGFRVEGQASTDAGEISIRLNVHRTNANKFFGIAAYVAMCILSLCAVTIGTLVFVGIRRIEVTMIGALGAVIFALPALRNALPGAPPLGVKADVFVFFWAELAAIVALALFVIAWARGGARPERPH